MYIYVLIVLIIIVKEVNRYKPKSDNNYQPS